MIPNQASAAAPAVATAEAGARARPIGRYTAAGEVAKEIADRLLASLGLVALAPLLLVIALAIRLDSPGPALYRQVRVGRHRRPFVFWKFRGMFVDAPARFPELYEYRYSAEEARDLRFHPARDPRVTRVGRFLRRTSLDELPNLINVVLGQMSLIGPRPEIPELIPYYGEAADPILSVKPGIASHAKLVGRDNITFSETLKLDLEYLRDRSLAGDLRILLATVWMVVAGRCVGR